MGRPNNSDKTKESGKLNPDNENTTGTSHPVVSPLNENETGKSHPVLSPPNTDEKKKQVKMKNLAERARSGLRRKSDTSFSYRRETRGRS